MRSGRTSEPKKKVQEHHLNRFTGVATLFAKFKNGALTTYPFAIGMVAMLMEPSQLLARVLSGLIR